MGARRLRGWFIQPLSSIEPIQKRQVVVKILSRMRLDWKVFGRICPDP